MRYARKFKFALASHRFQIERVIKVLSVLISLGAVASIISNTAVTSPRSKRR